MKVSLLFTHHIHCLLTCLLVFLVRHVQNLFKTFRFTYKNVITIVLHVLTVVPYFNLEQAHVFQLVLKVFTLILKELNAINAHPVV